MVVIKNCPKCHKPFGSLYDYNGKVYSNDVCKCQWEKPKVAPAPQPIPTTKIIIKNDMSFPAKLTLFHLTEKDMTCFAGLAKRSLNSLEEKLLCS